ncbi:sulfite exporter TauE/SafE family protein [Kordiimonas lipolytica]|uniref:Sulfite exporter TauE/SafE family protein n=1 Tax=Kordiimonas lipolytica TaxID=1662421 RepID=A0ABV8UG97_9PROT|nr:sulfite exporter TauE/SafE family protein [Kordiimonas lipolytica]
MELFIQYCQAAITDHGSVMVTLFLGGLLGSLTHCVGMCGPFVLAQVGAAGPGSQHDGQDRRLKRAAGGLLLPYHLGRMTTYMILGTLAASLSGYLFEIPVQRTITVSLLCLAAVLFLAAAFPGMKTRVWPPVLGRFLGRMGAMVGRAARPFFEAPSVFHRYALGVILGFLPCGLLAAALTAVAATAEPLAAAMAMGAFCVGTMPALFLIGSGGRFARKRWPRHMATAVRGVMVFNSISLFVIASSMVF